MSPGGEEDAKPGHAPDHASGARTIDTGEPAGMPVELSAKHYVDREEIGRGGMGTVRRTYDTRLLREVAMKMLSPELENSRARADLFVEEAQIAGQLEHPNIIPVHELGLDSNGVAYFTMTLVRGVSLHDWLHDPGRAVGKPERIEDGLDVFIKVCDAVSFAHSRGVIHRDLKPSNVMVGEFGQVYLTDWGLAKLTGSGVALGRERSSTQLVVGTHGYMAPEQACAKFDEQDERTDVFGLGAVLYEIVTGKAPYPDSEAWPDPAAMQGAYVPPEQTLGDVRISGRLLRIIKRALARDRDDRFATAADLKAAVQGFVRGGLHLPRAGFAAGTRIVVEGDVGDAAYIILRGECIAYRTIDGEKKILRRMTKGDVFGELAILSNVPRTATVEAVGPVTVLVVTRAVLDEELGPDSWVGSLVRALAERFRELDARAGHGTP